VKDAAKCNIPSCREFNFLLSDISLIALSAPCAIKFPIFWALCVKMSYDTDQARLVDRIQASAFYQAK
jgi:hypothetical protein